MDVCLREVEQIKPREWRAPSIWHATLWLRDLAAWNRIGRPSQPGLSKAFEDALPGPFLFRGQRNADWPLTPSILREPALERERYGLAIMRFILAGEQLSSQAEIPVSMAEAFIGAAQHYDLPTWFLDFSVDPISAAFFASDKAVQGEEAAIYWLPMDAALRLGAKVILAPFWVERLYAQLGCFLDRSSLIDTPDSDELVTECYRIVFPASGDLSKSEYGNVGNRIYPESKWMKAALDWAINSKIPPEDSIRLTTELVDAAGRPPWIAGSTYPRSHERMLEFASRIAEWTVLRVSGNREEDRRCVVEDEQMRLLLRHNLGVYAQLNHVVGVLKKMNVFPTSDIDLRSNRVGAKALLVWLYNQHSDAE